MGTVALTASPAQKAGVAQSVLSGEGQQREPAASVVFENPSDLMVGTMSPGRADY
jgi:hypothetical protein